MFEYDNNVPALSRAHDLDKTTGKGTVGVLKPFHGTLDAWSHEQKLWCRGKEIEDAWNTWRSDPQVHVGFGYSLYWG